MNQSHFFKFYKLRELYNSRSLYQLFILFIFALIFISILIFINIILLTNLRAEIFFNKNDHKKQSDLPPISPSISSANNSPNVPISTFNQNNNNSNLNNQNNIINKQQVLDLAQQGDVISMLQLGYLFYSESKSSVSLANARKWFKSAADQSEARAMLAYGYFLAEGIGGYKNLAEGKFLLQKSADLGLYRALFILSRLEAKVPGAQKRIESRRLLEQAALYDPMAQNALGIELETEGSMTQAKEWYLSASRLGNEASSFNLKRLNHISDNFKKFYLDDLFYRVKNADAAAMFELATYYHRGQNIKQDYQEAIRLYKKSAELGDPRAIEIMALIATLQPDNFNTKMQEILFKLNKFDYADGQLTQFDRPRRDDDFLKGLLDFSFSPIDKIKPIRESEKE